IRPGMPVYGSDGQPVGTAEAVDGAGLVVRGRRIPAEALARVAPDGVTLRRPAAHYLTAPDDHPATDAAVEHPPPGLEPMRVEM
ncbi:MAG TPA: hypothetical protein VFW96_08030, partial [Thermomicrobiales bacterium]|nr:hypothetical protein [Thermomicrobiales bacterium]